MKLEALESSPNQGIERLSEISSEKDEIIKKLNINLASHK